MIADFAAGESQSGRWLYKMQRASQLDGPSLLATKIYRLTNSARHQLHKSISSMNK